MSLKRDQWSPSQQHLTKNTNKNKNKNTNTNKRRETTAIDNNIKF